MSSGFTSLITRISAGRKSSRRRQPPVPIVSWIDALPVELLIAIFEFACQAIPPIPPRDQYRLHHFKPRSSSTDQLAGHVDHFHPCPPLPLVTSDLIDTLLVVRISHVSQKWRDVVTSMSKFWQSLELGHGDLREKVDTWLNRLDQARMKEILIRAPFMRRMLSGGQDAALSLPLKLPNILRVEIPNAGRERLDIRPRLEKLFGQRLTGLETLEMSLSRTEEAKKERPLAHYTPPSDGHVNLRSLTLRGLTIAAPSIGSPNLVYLELREIFWSSPADVFFSVVQSSPNLESLVVTDFYSSASVPIRQAVSAVTRLHHLTHLELGGGGHMIWYLLTHGRFPNLRSLRLIHTRSAKAKRHGSDPKDPLRILLSTQFSMCLKELHLHGNSFESKTLAKTLDRFGEDLELLEITHQWSGSDFHQAVSLLRFPKEPVSSSDPALPAWLCPRVTTLIFVWCPGLRIVKELVAARERAAFEHYVCSIKTLVVEACMGDADFIEDLVGGGLIESRRDAKVPEGQRLPPHQASTGPGIMSWIRR